MGITRRREPGQVLVVFAITVTSMLAVIGLLYTFGLVLAQRRALQTAADAASLRGSWQVLQELSSDNLSDSAVSATINTFALDNGAATGGTTALYVDGLGNPLTPSAGVGSGGAVPNLARGVQVSVRSTVPIILNGFVKLSQSFIGDSATATATARPTASVATPQVLPLAVSSADMRAAFLAHATYDLFAHNLSGNQAPTLDFGSVVPPASSYSGFPATNEQDWSEGGYTGSWSLPMPLPTSVNLALSPGTASTSETGTTATYVVANTLQANETVSISGCSVAGYNGTNLVVASASGSAFTVGLSTAGLGPGTGAVVQVTYYDAVAAGLHANVARQALPADASGAAYALVKVPVYDSSSATAVHIVGFAQFKIRDSAISSTSAVGTFVPYAIAAFGTTTAAATDYGAALVMLVS